MSTLAQRIRESRLAVGITEPADLARRIGKKPSAAYQWENGQIKSLKYDTAVALSEVLGVSPDWLATGKGPKHNLSVRDAPGAYVVEPNATDAPRVRDGFRRYLAISDADFSPSSGPHIRSEVLRELEIAEWKLQQEFGVLPSPEFVRIYTVRGDANAPRLRDGDIVFVDTRDRAVVDGGFFIIVLHGYVLVKRLSIRTDGLHMNSIADLDRPDVVPPADMHNVQIAGRVLGAVLLRGSEEVRRLH